LYSGISSHTLCNFLSNTVPSPTPTLSPTAIMTPTPTATPTTTPSPTPTPTAPPIPPALTITSPATGSTVPRRTIVTITATATSNVGIAKVEFYVNNTLLCTDTSASYTCNWKVPSTRNIQYTITAK